ncbi:MAG: HD-GYP domain-containing protein [Clostridia bacterium]|nr:HD-GYP domain-containing protein [Clostridia bacterium]
MLDKVTLALYCIASFFGYLMIARYVFFEKGLIGTKKAVYYVIGTLGILLSAFFIPDEVAVNLIAAGLFIAWMVTQRKERKFFGFLTAFAVIGFGDGIFLSLITIPSALFNLNSYVQFVICAALALFLVFATYWLEKRNSNNLSKIDATLGNNMDLDSHNRKLSRTEKIMLFCVGIFEQLLASAVDLLQVTDFLKLDHNEVGGQIITDQNLIFEVRDVLELTTLSIKALIFLLGAAMLFITVVVIVVVLSGNRRSFLLNRVSDMQTNIIVTMADIVENRDADTGGHIQRTAKYVEIIANQMKSNGPYQKYMTPQFMQDIKIAAPLHDIGKIHVSDTILNFPGRLDDRQFAIMKTHAAEGRKLLTQAKKRLGEFSYLDVAIDMAGYHHEWWDGGIKGYPTRIKGEDIPLCARIMAVADVFDALTARRVYKDPMPMEKAISIILEEKGTHFDPAVVDAFMEAIDEVKTALNEFDEAARVAMANAT